MEGTLIQLPDTGGFNQLPAPKGVSHISFVPKVGISNEYLLGEQAKVTGLCSYHFLMAAGVVRGVLFRSPKAHTVVSPTTIKIGTCGGPFSLNTNLQKLGILMYISPDSSVLIIPVEVKSPLLVEVDNI